MTSTPNLRDFEAEVYGAGRFARCPYEFVASFVFRNMPRKPRREIEIMEVGCGTGNNLWFLAHEGFSVVGIDGSPSAVDYSRNWLESAGFSAELAVGNFVKLPFADNRFDLIFDRAALCYLGFSQIAAAVQEIHRVLKPGGRFLFNPYSTLHPGYQTGKPGADRITLEAQGPFAITFFDRPMLDELFAGSWEYVNVWHTEITDDQSTKSVNGDWRVELERLP